MSDNVGLSHAASMTIVGENELLATAAAATAAASTFPLNFVDGGSDSVDSNESRRFWRN